MQILIAFNRKMFYFLAFEQSCRRISSHTVPTTKDIHKTKMIGFITKPAKEINQSLIEFLPELDSDYARYPMSHPKWYSHLDVGPKGERCFIPFNGVDPVPAKKDYVYGDGIAGKGYYSLLCHASYECLHEKLKSRKPKATLFQKLMPEYWSARDRYDDVKRVIWMRKACTQKPDDKLASDIVLNGALPGDSRGGFLDTIPISRYDVDKRFAESWIPKDQREEIKGGWNKMKL